MKQVYRHYGSDHFDPKLFMPVRNGDAYMNKPAAGTGLWSSPVKNDKTDWAEWCEDNDFRLSRLKTYFDFTLKNNARVAVVRTMDDMKKLPLDYESFRRHLALNGNPFEKDYPLDFEKLAEKYDALMYWNSWDMHWERVWNCWDVDTLYVLNPDVIEPAG